jgi:hypothetical protein
MTYGYPISLNMAIEKALVGASGSQAFLPVGEYDLALMQIPFFAYSYLLYFFPAVASISGCSHKSMKSIYVFLLLHVMLWTAYATPAHNETANCALEKSNYYSNKNINNSLTDVNDATQA